jgi:Polyketide cyclase / dehydrase and lipid transport
VFAQSADDIWNTIRDFNNYPVWGDGAGESRIEDGQAGDVVGAVRDVLYQGKRIRQRLVALSDAERAQVYEFCGAAPMAVQHHRATLRITPVIDGFVEWWATFDCTPERHDEWVVFFRDAFAGWLASLRRYLDGRNALSRRLFRIEAAGIPAHTE